MRFSRRAALTLIVLATSSVAAQAQGYYNPNAYLMSQGAYLGPGYAGAPLNPTLAPLVAAQQAQLAQQQQALAAQQQMQLGQPTQGASSQQSPGVSGTGGAAQTGVIVPSAAALTAPARSPRAGPGLARTTTARRGIAHKSETDRHLPRQRLHAEPPHRDRRLGAAGGS